jgi:hypothetical protein
MPEVPAVWAAPGAPAPATEDAPAIRPAPREPEPHGHEGLRPIPLRPLTVLELLDGAIGAVRAIPPALLGWASLVVVAAGLAEFVLTWVFDAAVAAATRVHPLIVTDVFGNTTVEYGKTGGAGSLGVGLFQAAMPITLSGFAVTILAGLIAEPVRHYVDGATATAPEPARNARALVGRLSAVAAVTVLPRALFALLCALTTLGVVNDPNGGYGVLFVPILLLGIPLCLWLAADWAVAAPVVALEGATSRAALRRARRLVAGGRWRTAWATGLTLFIATTVITPLSICAAYIGSDHGVDDLFKGDPVSGATYWWLAGYVFVIVLAEVLTAPYRAAVATMLYVDRRFRREGLDIRIAWARVARNSAKGR